MLNANIPNVPLDEKWTDHKFNLNLVNPANKRKHTVIVVGTGLALSQFADWFPIITVIAIFLIGQTAESYVLTPKLVGARVGLHPIWVIFSLLAGGSLFGFTGVLLAVPVTAVIGVLVRFAIGRYLESPLYGDANPPKTE